MDQFGFRSEKMFKIFLKEQEKRFMAWAEKNGCAFHLDGEKGPVYLAYLKKGEDFPPEFDTLKLGPAKILRKSEDRVLGTLIASIRSDDRVLGTLIASIRSDERVRGNV